MDRDNCRKTYTDETIGEFIRQVNDIGPTEIIKVQVVFDDERTDVCAERVRSKT